MKTLLNAMILILGLLLINSLAISADLQEAIVQRVLSGDTLLVKTAEKVERVRLLGITCQNPTPKTLKERFNKEEALKGDRALAFVNFLVKPGDTVGLEFDKQGRDRAGNLLAYVFLGDGSLLNEKLVLEGLAWPRKMAPNSKYDKKFQKASEKTKKK